MGAPLAISYLGASLLPARAAGSLVIQGTNLVARGAREGSLKASAIWAQSSVGCIWVGALLEAG